MENKGTIKNIVIGLILAVGAVAVYAMVADVSEGEDGSSSFTSLIGSGSIGQVQENDTQLANAEILRILGSIQNIDLEDDIFTDPVFRELRDGRFSIPNPTVIGRPNPFRPIGLDSIATITSPQNITSEAAFANFFDDISTDDSGQSNESENPISDESSFFDLDSSSAI